MTKMSIKKALSEFDDGVEKRLREKERISLTRGGKTIAIMISVDDFKKLRELEMEEIDDLRDAKRELEIWKRDKKSIPWELVKQENGL